MKTKIICSSEIHVLSTLLYASDMLTVAYDPENNVCTDDENVFLVAKSLTEIARIISENKHDKLCIINNSKHILDFDEADFIIEFNSRSNHQQKRKISWCYVCNPNGTLRWIYPPTISKPWFLAFYNFDYWKAACYKMVVKTMFFLRLPKVVSNGTITIYTNQLLNVEDLSGANNSAKNQYAIFSGTYGPNRKIILAVADKNQISAFYKIALNKRSEENIHNEYKMIQKLRQAKMACVEIPEADWIDDKTIRVSNIKRAHYVKQYAFDEKHAQFLNGLYGLSCSQERFNDLQICIHIEQWLRKIRVHPRLKAIPLAEGLYDKLSSLHERLSNENPLIPIAINHGDFTRWNCYQDENKIYVYDWELSHENMPILYDFFHFVIHGEIYSSNANPTEIQNQLNNALNRFHIRKIIQGFDIDAMLHLQLYLLHNASYYLDMYLCQQNLHKEVSPLFKTWSGLLLNEKRKSMTQPHRNEFIEALFYFMADKKYVLLKNIGKSISDLSYTSDIDLLVLKSDISSIMEFSKTDLRIQKVKCAHKSFMTTLQLFFFDNSFLSIDLLNAFQRKTIQYIDSRLLLESSIVENGIKILPVEYDYLYIFLFYQINFSCVPDKYTDHLKVLSTIQERKMLKILEVNTGLSFASVSQTFSFSAQARSNIFSFLKKKKGNNILKRISRQMRYGMDSIRDFIHNRGVMLTFSGVDGAGKSTILNEVKDLLEKKYRKKVVVIRHRPSVLPILSAWKYGKEEAEKKCAESLPRKGDNKSKLSSLLRFGYYYADYLFGQSVVYVKYILRGHIVLYDRYYFDFIVDGKRSNMIVNKSFIKSLYRFVYKAELNVFLFAQPDVILKRKQELSAEDITQLTRNYKNLFSQLGNRPQYNCIENIDKIETLHKIEQAFLQIS